MLSKADESHHRLCLKRCVLVWGKFEILVKLTRRMLISHIEQLSSNPFSGPANEDPRKQLVTVQATGLYN